MTQKESKSIRIGIDDFIGSTVKVPDSKVFKQDKLMDFAGIKVGTIDPRISSEVLDLAQKIRDKVTEISNLE